MTPSFGKRGRHRLASPVDGSETGVPGPAQVDVRGGVGAGGSIVGSAFGANSQVTYIHEQHIHQVLPAGARGEAETAAHELAAVQRCLTETGEKLNKATEVAERAHAMISILLVMWARAHGSVIELTAERDSGHARERAETEARLGPARLRLERTERELERARQHRYTAEQARQALIVEAEEARRELADLRLRAAGLGLDPDAGDDSPERGLRPAWQEIDPGGDPDFADYDEALERIADEGAEREQELANLVDCTGITERQAADGPQIITGTVLTAPGESPPDPGEGPNAAPVVGAPVWGPGSPLPLLGVDATAVAGDHSRPAPVLAADAVTVPVGAEAVAQTTLGFSQLLSTNADMQATNADMQATTMRIRDEVQRVQAALSDLQGAAEVAGDPSLPAAPPQATALPTTALPPPYRSQAFRPCTGNAVGWSSFLLMNVLCYGVTATFTEGIRASPGAGIWNLIVYAVLALPALAVVGALLVFPMEGSLITVGDPCSACWLTIRLTLPAGLIMPWFDHPWHWLADQLNIRIETDQQPWLWLADHLDIEQPWPWLADAVGLI